MNYAQAVEILGANKVKTIGNNTVLVRKDNEDGTADIQIVLHSTPVVTLHDDSTFTLDSGGFRTNTTKRRINQYAPVKLYQAKKEWRLDDSERDPHAPYWKFYDGINVDELGVPTFNDR